MSVKTIAILMPGDMGHGCAIAFRENGFRVVTNLAERSERTKGLSAKAGLEDLGSFGSSVRDFRRLRRDRPHQLRNGCQESIGRVLGALDA